MKVINSINNEHIKELAKLNIKKYREEKKLFLIEGYHLVEMAKKYLVEILVTNEKDIPKWFDESKVSLVNDKIIEKLANTKTPEMIIGVCKYMNESKTYGDKILLLDNLQDPGNIGTLIRSSLAFDIDTIVLGNKSVDIYNDKLIRSTQGAIFKINIVSRELKEVIEELKKDKVYVIGTSLKRAIPLNDVGKMNRYAILLGNEGNGVSEDLLKLTDINVMIPMNKKIDSLNVGVAGGIIMFYMNNN